MSAFTEIREIGELPNNTNLILNHGRGRWNFSNSYAATCSETLVEVDGIIEERNMASWKKAIYWYIESQPEMVGEWTESGSSLAILTGQTFQNVLQIMKIWLEENNGDI